MTDRASADSALAFYHPTGAHPAWLDGLAGRHRRIASRSALRDSFSSGFAIVGFCAAGILIRQLSDLLSDKWREPPVLMVTGVPGEGHIVPLLGANHGGNRLASRLAQCWRMRAVVSTASHALGFSPDDPPAGWAVRHAHHSKTLAAKLLCGETLSALYDPPLDLAMLTDDAKIPIAPADDGVTPDLRVSLSVHDDDCLQLCPKMLTVGMGMIRHADCAALEDLLLRSLAKAHLAPEAVACLVSIDVKDNEAALYQLAAKYDVPLRFFAKTQLAAVEVPNPSEAVLAQVGTGSVAEAAALLAAGEGARLLVEKQKNNDGTCAIAVAQNPILPGLLPGRRGGILRVIGLGPGANYYRLPAANNALTEAETIVGYGLYLDWIRSEFPHADYIALPLGAESERAACALETAMSGKHTALVCSGDAGIYALATLVMEQAAALAHPPFIEVIPGITAMQMLAARIGAPLGHDFCAISLSDLLTPREKILQRVQAAAEGDFVVSFYNPQSRKRRDLLDQALDILRDHRPAAAPVIVGRNLARDDERISISTLADVDSTDIDMFCLVTVGASETEISAHRQIFTPRGYTSSKRKPEAV